MMASLIAGVLIVCGFCLMLLPRSAGSPAAPRQGTACGPAQTVGATEYGGPGDPSSGTVGASGVSLLRAAGELRRARWHELLHRDGARRPALRHPLQISAGRRTVVAYKEDIGLGGGPIGGRPRVIDLWWQLARSLGIPYEDGRWSGTVKIEPLAGCCAEVDVRDRRPSHLGGSARDAAARRRRGRARLGAGGGQGHHRRR